MIRLLQLTSLLLIIISCRTLNNPTNSIRNKIEQIVKDKNAIVGVSIIGNNQKDTISLNGDKQFPLQSVFKYHIALAVLSQIDKGNFSLDQKIEVNKNDLLPNLWSPLRDENPNGGSFTIAQLIQYSVSKSDNVACDILLKIIGGPSIAEDYLKKNNIKDVSIKLNEEVQQSNWDLQFKNWITPKSASQTLLKFYSNKDLLLSKESYDFIWKTMKETKTGEKRLKGLLPKGTIVAHKTGTSGTNKEGLSAAVNDIGVVFLPNGKYFFISVFVANSRENEETNEKIIADISKTTYEFFNTK